MKYAEISSWSLKPEDGCCRLQLISSVVNLPPFLLRLYPVCNYSALSSDQRDVSSETDIIINSTVTALQIPITSRPSSSDSRSAAREVQTQEDALRVQDCMPYSTETELGHGRAW